MLYIIFIEMVLHYPILGHEMMRWWCGLSGSPTDLEVVVGEPDYDLVNLPQWLRFFTSLFFVSAVQTNSALQWTWYEVERPQFFCIFLFRMVLVTDWSIEKYYFLKVKSRWHSPTRDRFSHEVDEPPLRWRGWTARFWSRTCTSWAVSPWLLEPLE